MLTVLEVCFFIAMFLIVVSQILIPGIKGIKLFPIFRKESDLKKEIVDLEQQFHDEEIRRSVAKLQQRNKKAVMSKKVLK